MTYSYLEDTIDYMVIYKKRKSLGIYINVYGQIELRVPKDTKDEQLIALLEAKWHWIIEKRAEMKALSSGHKDKIYDHGEKFMYLGCSYPIVINENENVEREYVEFESETLHVYVKSHEDATIKQALKRFYYQQCKALVESRIRIYQKNFKIKPRSIKIADNKSNWGTCDSLQHVTFNWKLAMAPMDVIDYVVVHELCHMVHLNHDRSFWRLVGKILPDYEDKQKWLAQSSWKMIV